MRSFFIFLFLSSIKIPSVLAQTGQVTVPDLTAVPQATGDAGTKLGGWIQGFYQFSLIAGVFLAVGVIVWAGLRYALAAGNPSTQSDARDQILQALLGLILLMGAYLVLTTVNPNLTNLVPPTINRVGELVGPGNGLNFADPLNNGWASGVGQLTDSQATTLLGMNHIGVKDCVGAGADCVPANLEGLQRSTLDGITAFKADCRCNITITSGTDSHAAGTAHANGYKLDLGINAGIDNFVTGGNAAPQIGQTNNNGFTYLGLRSDNAPQYRDPSGNIYARESNHWDVLYKAPGT